jgi:L-fuconate dehydratase
MNTDPDYSAAYVALETDHPDGLSGHGLTFTIGRGTEVCVAAIEALAPHVVGSTVEELVDDLGGMWRRLVTDSQLRWLGPEKGVIHPLPRRSSMRSGISTRSSREAALEAPRGSAARADRRVRRLPRIEDALTPDEALGIPASPGGGQAGAGGHPARGRVSRLHHSAGWPGYSKTASERARSARRGFTHLKLKVGGDPATDLRRARILREAIGGDVQLSLDANQAWGITQAIDAIGALSEVDPWWIEEPTSPDDVLGHRRIREAIAPLRIATGEPIEPHRLQAILQLGAVDFCQVDCCRLGGVNEVLAVVLLAAKFGIPIRPHAGGGL